MGEIWKDVSGYEGKCMVSNLGNIKSIKKDKILSPKNNHDGYLRIQLWEKCKVKFVSIHRLVAEAFIPNPENKPFVNHVNGVKNCNTVENLEWVTQRENINHAWENGLSKPQINGKHSKSVDQLDLGGNYIKTFPSTMEVERQLGINHVNISSVCRGKKHCKTAGGYKWRYSSGDTYE
ncbi:NUMOD4 domain-containing protein [Metabacillus arenae]|uniref:HNH endonuclease n=1 Tax=Metabacillus arenae TaxID=2771434 RepID=A0A926NFK1_9BACI|nr:NUMOD4 domain-containing protein [Metabacillus arenae]MBD1379088.1 HNH endonuclease [Metabacillus arenae]